MKKLFNGRFLFILASSLVVLILLVVGAFYLFDDEDDVFIKSGYVLNPLSSTSEKYFFDESAGYKENLSSMIEFVDVDNNTVSVLKDSFLHYNDESISFLKKGAMLDLDTLNKDNKAVSFYNITKKSIIEKKDSGYFIESAAGDVRITNFIGRISDNKYIVVGDLSLKIAGNATTIEGDYFEIVYVEEGIVNIENKNVKYQVAAAGTLIYVGSDKVIDLGEKKISVKDVDVMSITAITIDGNENIEIVPKAPEEDGSGGGGGTGTGDGDGDGEGTGSGSGNGSSGDGGSGGGDGDGSGSGSGGTGEVIEEVVVSLKNAKTGSTNIDVVFDVINAKNDDVFKLQVVNLDSGRTVDIVAEVKTDALIKVNLLTPNTKYLFSVINEKDNGKYFQKVLETTGFGIKLEKSYATESSLAYKVIIDEGTDITNAKLTLYKFNEETNKNEIVTDSYVDSVTGETITSEKITYLSSLKENLEGEHEIIYEGLESNAIYTAVLDEFSIASSNFKDIYNVTLTSMTLKRVPKFSEMTVTKDVGSGSFDLSLGNIVDLDNAIVKYTYMIYDKMDGEMAIEPIVHNNASPITVKVGDRENQLKNDTNYYYKVVIEYFDNEKYIEYVTTDSIIFMMGNDPYVTVVPNEDKITHNKIVASIYLIDNSCLISIPGREKCGGASTTVVEVSRVNPLTGELAVVSSELVTFDVSEEEIKYDLTAENLQPGTTYVVSVKANLNNTVSLEKTELLHTDESKRTITTRSLSSFKVEWTNYQGNMTHVVNAALQLKSTEEQDTLSPEESLETIDKVVISLYKNRVTSDISRAIPIGEKIIRKSNGVDIKALIYDALYGVSSFDTFDFTIDDLKDLNVDKKLNEYYTIYIEAFTDTNYRINLIDNIYAYRVSSILLMDEIEEPVIEVNEVSNFASGKLFGNLSNGGTIVGYDITAAFDRNQLIVNNIIPNKINFYVYNNNSETKEKIKFYIQNEDGELVLVDKVTGDLEENNFYGTRIFMDYGTSYETVDDIMRRGNSFYIGYEIETLADGGTLLYPVATDPESPSPYGVYMLKEEYKETPNVKMYIASSTANSITYAYTVDDPDNAFYKSADSEEYGFYYTINDRNENKYTLTMDTESQYNRFVGKMTIDSLRRGDLYKIYYKKNNIKTGVFEYDVVDYLDGYSSGIRMFDGYFDAKSNELLYNFKYSIINNAEKDNKVVIKILASDVLLEKILSYKLSFKDSKGNVLNKELWQLTTCDGEDPTKTPRCLSVDYGELNDPNGDKKYDDSMKSGNNEINKIKVTVTAVYDNGLSGYDFVVGGSDYDYQYCILQTNSSENGLGSYVILSGTQATVWTETLGAPKGYYTYKLTNSMLNYTSYLGGKPVAIGIGLGSSGYSTNHGFVTPKMVSFDEMGCSSSSSSCNEFSFSSITPKVSVTEKAPVINGSVLNFKLSGIDINDVKLESDNERYLYVETWENKELAENGDLESVVRPVTKVEIDADPLKTVAQLIDGLKENTAYYYNVYAYMNKNGEYVYTQLFDAAVTDKYVTKTYTFRTARPSDLFHSLDVNHTSSDKIYGNRTLNTKINLLAYKNSIAFNFELVYALCETHIINEYGNSHSNTNCGLIEEGKTNIFQKTIPASKITSTIVNDSVDISEYDLEYGKDYYMYVYARANFYETPTEDGRTTRNIVLNRYNINVKLKALRKPTFTVTREANVINGEYLIDFNITVSDPDRTLVNGNYYIKLLNSSNSLVGEMQFQDEEGAYYGVPNYDTYAFDAFTVSKNVRITGLEPDSKYSFIVHNDAYINNKDMTDIDPDGTTCEGKICEIKRPYTVYTTNNYGVAFGKDITYSATEKSIIVTFLGGSNFNNVKEVNYTVGLWDDVTSASTVSGTFVIGEKNKYFEMYKDSSDWRFVIDPAGMKNTLGKTYAVSIGFKIYDPVTETDVVLTSADVPGFEGKAIYVEDE